MIQIKRGKSESWRKAKELLAPGQPGYDKDKHKIKIGDGEKSWSELEYASGLSETGVLDSEENAKKKLKTDDKDVTVITYGTKSPDKNMAGRLYLQYYDSDPEVDYVVESGGNGIWTYKKWLSGKAECYGILEVNTDIQENLGSLFCNSGATEKIDYPITFKNTPCEIASIQSPGGIVWLASSNKNTSKQSALYLIISPNKQTNRAIYQISIIASGFWK